MESVEKGNLLKQTFSKGISFLVFLFYFTRKYITNNDKIVLIADIGGKRMIVDDQNISKGEHERGGCMVGFRVKANKGVQ